MLKQVGSKPRRRAFTIMELLVVIVVIGLLIAILMPALGKARDLVRDNQCRSNLRQIGMGLHSYAQGEPTVCSGAFDWRRDGCVTERGWVADLLKQSILVGELLCPANPAQLSDQYNDFLSLDPNSFQCSNGLGSRDFTMPDGTTASNPCRQLAAATDRASVLTEVFLEGGINTNYAASWFLVRGEVDINSSGVLVGDVNGDCPPTLIDRNGTKGPLASVRMGTGPVPVNRIPLMGCAATSQLPLTQSVGPYPAGSLLAVGFTRGPVDRDTLKAPAINSGTSAQGPNGWWGRWNDTLQDYRNFAPVHGGRQGSCNVLFLDGSVRSFVDLNGDGLLNNGFDEGVGGFQPGAIELPPAEIYSGWSLTPGRVRK